MVSTSAGAAPRSRWAGVPAEKRQAERRVRLLDAGFALMGTHGAAAVTVRAVCRDAGLNARYFYEHFDSTGELMGEVYQRTVTELFSDMSTAAASAGGPPEARFRAAMAACVRFIDADRRRGRVVFAEGRGESIVEDRRRVAWRRLLGRVARDLVSAEPSEVPSNVGPIRATMMAGAFTAALVAWIDGNLDVTRDQLIDDVTDIALAVVRWTPTR